MHSWQPLEFKLEAFVRQRTRWASKAVKYTDCDSIVTGLAVGAMNALLLVLFLGIFYKEIWNLWVRFPDQIFCGLYLPLEN